MNAVRLRVVVVVGRRVLELRVVVVGEGVVGSLVVVGVLVVVEGVVVGLLLVVGEGFDFVVWVDFVVEGEEEEEVFFFWPLRLPCGWPSFPWLHENHESSWYLYWGWGLWFSP